MVNRNLSPKQFPPEGEDKPTMRGVFKSLPLAGKVATVAGAASMAVNVFAPLIRR